MLPGSERDVEGGRQRWKVERVREAEQGLSEYESGEKEGSWVALTRASWRN